MAGAGYKLFTTGQVLTAAEVNTYLQEQTVMVFNDAASRTTALSGVLAEGMVSYLKSTKVVEIYTGAAWVSLDDPNAIQNTIVDAKGDLITATGNDVPARLAVGNNGETLVADSSTSTGLRYANNYGFTAGKNKIINGDFFINQRGFTSIATNGAYTFDRWATQCSGGTVTYSAQTFTPGTAPVSGYEGANFLRIATTGQNAQNQYALIEQRIENVRTFAGQTVTLSFWAKASSGTPYMWLEYQQNFGTGGSSTNFQQAGTTQTLSTSWQRYSVTFSVMSLAGNTIGTGSYFTVYLFTSVGTSIRGFTNATFQNATIDIWGVQIETGSVATPFSTATGTLAGELAACQRYYLRLTGTNTYSSFGVGWATSTTTGVARVVFPVQMRTAPSTSLDVSGNFRWTDEVSQFTATNLFISNTEQHNLSVIVGGTSSTVTQYRPLYLTANNDATAYLGFSAEL